MNYKNSNYLVKHHFPGSQTSQFTSLAANYLFQFHPSFWYITGCCCCGLIIWIIHCCNRGSEKENACLIFLYLLSIILIKSCCIK